MRASATDLAIEVTAFEIVTALVGIDATCGEIAAGLPLVTAREENALIFDTVPKRADIVRAVAGVLALPLCASKVEPGSDGRTAHQATE